jgi:hypothetical protein
VADLWAELTPGSPLDLSGVGDGARGFIQYSLGVIVLSSGQLVEVIGASPSQPSDVQRLAQAAANYINAAGLGS